MARISRRKSVSLANLASQAHTSFFPPTSVCENTLRRWDATIKRYSERSARRFHLPSAESQDLAQEARIKVLRVLRGTPHATDPLIRRVIFIAALKTAERAVRLGSVITPESLSGSTNERKLASHTSQPEALALTLWVERLPEPLRILVRLLYYEGCTQREVAARLGLSQPRIAQLHSLVLNRGRNDLASKN
jgi:RNA polymerase sigma factor (sigma-70 family)